MEVFMREYGGFLDEQTLVCEEKGYSKYDGKILFIKVITNKTPNGKYYLQFKTKYNSADDYDKLNEIVTINQEGGLYPINEPVIPCT